MNPRPRRARDLVPLALAAGAVALGGLVAPSAAAAASVDEIASAPNLYSHGKKSSHVCSAGGFARQADGGTVVFDPRPCTAQYAPVPVHRGGGVVITTPDGDPDGATLSVESGAARRAVACRKERARRFRCAMPDPGRQTQARLRLRYPNGASSWIFDVRRHRHRLVRRAIDRNSNVAFRLSGRLLTAALWSDGRHFSDTRSYLQGHTVRAVCGTSFDYDNAVMATATRRWPRTARRLTFRLSRDITRRARWCLLEERGGRDLAFAKFAKR